MCVSVCLHECRCTHLCLLPTEVREGSQIALELELGVTVNHLEGAGN